MNKFELYHPIFTNRLVLDWLTKSKIKSIFELRHNPTIAEQVGRPIDATIEATTTYVNQMMRLVMNNEALIWGITRQSDQQFLGSFAIMDFDHDQKTATLQFELLPAYQHQGYLKEVLTHMINFSFAELGLSQINVLLPPTNQVAKPLLIAAGFTPITTASRTVYQLQRP
jgi:ribosomal-protein-alanine N-acetyltransferase